MCKDRCDDTMVKCQPLARTQQGGVGRIPGGQFQVAPTNPAPKTSPFKKGGMNAPIMRRGVEGEPATSTPTEQEERATAPKWEGARESANAYGCRTRVEALSGTSPP